MNGLGRADVRVGIANATVGYLLGGLGACGILLARDLDVSRGEIAWLASGFGGALLLAGAIGSWVLGAGAARVLRICAAGLGVGSALLAVAPSLRLAQLGAVLLGAGAAGIVLATTALLTGARAAARLAAVTAAGMLAGVLGPALLSVVDATTGNGRLALLVPLPALLWLAAAPLGAPESPADVDPGTAGGASPTLVARRWLCIVLAVSAEFAFHLWGAARLQDSGLGVTAAAASAAGFPLGMAAGRLGAVRLIGTAPVVALGAGLGIAGALVLATPAGPVVATLAIAVAGLGIALLYPVTLAQLIGTPGLRVGHGAALGAAASGTAALAAPAAIQVLAAATSLATSFLAVAAVLALLVGLSRPRGPRRYRMSRRSRTSIPPT